MANRTQPKLDTRALSIVLNRYGVDDVVVFGSFARGEANSHSDLDLLVTYPKNMNLVDSMELQDELEAITGRKVDLISKKYLSKRLAKRIQAEIKPLQSL